MKNTNLNRFFAAEGISFDLDSHKTGCNGNTIVCGASGAGKTRSIVTPNLLACNGSYIVSDPKGNLYSKYHKVLETEGYKTYLIDFINLNQGEGYNFFHGLHTEEDFLRVADIIVRTHSNKGTTDSAFWDNCEMFTLAGLLGLITELQHIMESVPEELPDLCNEFSSNEFMSIVMKRFLKRHELRYPQTIGGMTNMLDDMSKEFSIDPELRKDCIKHYMDQYLDALKGSTIGKPDMRSVLSVIQEVKQQLHPDITAVMRSVNEIVDTAIQTGRFGWGVHCKESVSAFLQSAINETVALLRNIERHDMFTEVGLLKAIRPNAFGVKQLSKVLNMSAERTASNILITAHAALARYDSEAINGMMTRASEDPFDFTSIGRQKTAVFICVSDTDRKMDGFANILYTQILQDLCKYADTSCENNALPVPVSFIFDDFCTNVSIPAFPKMVSSFRSRNIGCLLMIQSESQLEQYYGYDAKTIIANCDTYIYLGCSDLATAREISERTDKPIEEILYMPIGYNIIFRRGERPRFGRNINHDRFLEWIGFENTTPGIHSAKAIDRA